MEGLFFYWISWMAIIVLIFFISHHTFNRDQITFHLLMIIILSRYTVEFFHFIMQLSGVYIIFVTCFLIRKLAYPRLVNFIFSSFIIALAYASFYLFVILDPVWVFIDPKYLLTIFINYLVILLFKEWKMRIAVLLLGMGLGDVLYSFVLVQQGLSYQSLSFVWHDQVSLCAIAQIVWLCGEWLSSQIRNYVQFKFPAGKKQNQSVR